MSYMVVTLDVSKLSGWLNADASCQVERRAYYAGARGCVREAGQRSWAGGGKSSVQGTASEESGRTQNMLLMSVTPDVFQLDMSALMFVNSLKSPFMLVMAETSQSAIASYIVVAVVALASYSTSAVLSSAVLVNALWQYIQMSLIAGCRNAYNAFRRARSLRPGVHGVVFSMHH